MKTITLLLCLAGGAAAAEDILVIADEIPAMEVFARQTRARAGLTSRIVKQEAMPATLSEYSRVAVYIHRDISPETEDAVLKYVRGGGRLILLHHSISSGKRKNKEWLPSFRIELPTGEFKDGGYRYVDDADWSLVNLAPDDPITTKGVKYDTQVEFHGEKRPALSIKTEIYLNHVLSGERKTLLGISWKDPADGKLYQQPTGAWMMRTGAGVTYYFMAGHAAADFDNPAYAQILANALAAKH